MSQGDFGDSCYTLLPLVPILLNFLRQSKIPAESLMPNTSSGSAASQADATIKEAIADLAENLQQEERLTITQIKFVYTSYDENVWSKAIFQVVASCSPKLISDKKSAELLSLFKKNKQDILMSDESCGGILGPVMDDLPRNHFQVLGAFCAFVRDNSQDVAAVSKALSKGILTPGGSKDAKELFQVMVEKAEPLFGRIAATKTAGFRN